MDPSIHRISPAELQPVARGVERAAPASADRADRSAHRAAVEEPPLAQGEQALDSPVDALDLVPFEILRDDALWTSERGWRAALLNTVLQASAQGASEELASQRAGQWSPGEFTASVPLDEGIRRGADQSAAAQTATNIGDADFTALPDGAVVQEPTSPAQLRPEDVDVGHARILAASVRHLWSVIRELAQSTEGHATLRLRERPTSSLISFASVGREWIHQGLGPAEQNRLMQWVLLDRLLASVAPHPLDRRGTGLFVIQNPARRDPPVAVRWRAERRTRVGLRGKLVHRLRLDLELHGHPVTCVLTAQRPALHVHITCSQDAPFIAYLRAAQQVLAPSLQACGWELTSWTVDDEGDGPDATH
ncbi:hypothetical protein [Alicyclobacillus acidocaldarius]|uniref:Uncharacterized protein n=1 Tax=Alicyclobacillus acidocaldarius (strain Tc-4-1) TaxID=1048834 RepID=F8IHU9_ALIAT|nr:hypothetical protein [Alicyclobacillus acidocaldarius]AEJ43239.1 hypothetical protein TC41_1300 [Alicyclobacillus acidocaldarius subsp. acidocaldarius Tc-4-1]